MKTLLAQMATVHTPDRQASTGLKKRLSKPSPHSLAAPRKRSSRRFCKKRSVCDKQPSANRPHGCANPRRLWHFWSLRGKSLTIACGHEIVHAIPPDTIAPTFVWFAHYVVILRSSVLPNG